MVTIKKQKLGLICAIVACILFWIPLYQVHTYILFIPVKKETINLLPNLVSGLLSLILIFLIYIRGIISFKSKKLRLASLLINWALLATFLEIVISPFSANPTRDAVLNNFVLLLFCVVFIAILLFGVKEIAKLILLVFILGTFFSNIMLVSDAMGFIGFIALGLVITSFYLQGNINLPVVETEAKYLFAQKKTVSLIDTAQKQVKSTVRGSVIGKIL